MNAALQRLMAAGELDLGPGDGLRVLQGTMEIANQMSILSRGLKQWGVRSATLNYFPTYLGYGADYVWNVAAEPDRNAAAHRMRKLAQLLAGRFDLFHFHFGTTLTLDHSDLPLLRERNVPVFMQHRGSDVRLLSVARRMNPYALAKVRNEQRIRERMRRLSRYIRHCVIADPELYPYVRDEYEFIHYVPRMIDLSQYPPVEPTANTTDVPLIVHAPTHAEIKGTPYLLKAIETLKLKHRFRFKLVQGLSHSQAKWWYRKADLIVDQLHIGAYGMFAVEAMAMGKPVICWISDYMKERYPASLPIISANPDTIVSVLDRALAERDKLPAIGRAGRQYVELYHDMTMNSKRCLAIYDRVLGKGRPN